MHDPRYDFIYYQLAALLLVVALGIVAVWPSVTLKFWSLFSKRLRNHLKNKR